MTSCAVSRKIFACQKVDLSEVSIWMKKHTILNLFLVLSFKHFKYNCDYEMYFRNSLKFSKGVIIKPKQPQQPYTIYQMPTL